MKLKEILLSKEIAAFIIIILIIAIVVFVNIKFKEHCINNGGKLIVSQNGYSCMYESR